MKRKLLFTFAALTTLFLCAAQPVMAQDASPNNGAFTISTTYPSLVMAIGEDADFSIKLNATSTASTVMLSMKDLPEGWEAVFRGGGKIIQAAYIEPGISTSVELKLTPPENLEPGTYSFSVEASNNSQTKVLPLELTIKDKVPASMSFDVDLPTLKGTPKTTFRYSATLKNDGDEELSVNLIADAPKYFVVVFKTGSQEVTSLPLSAGESKSVSIEVQPFPDTPSGEYALSVKAQSGNIESTLALTAEVTGQPSLSITTPEGTLSGKAYAGKETAVNFIVANTGTAPARQIELTSSLPTEWSVEFDPKTIDELPAGQQVEVAAKMKPADKAIAGDYMLQIGIKAADNVSEDIDYRVTVNTSTLWGVVGIALIAIAVLVVAFAVMRFGRR